MLATIIAAIAIAAIAIIIYVGRKIVNMHTHQIFPQNKWLYVSRAISTLWPTMSFILLSIIQVKTMYSLFINFISLIIYNGKKVDNEVQKEHPQIASGVGIFATSKIGRKFLGFE